MAEGIIHDIDPEPVRHQRLAGIDARMPVLPGILEFTLMEEHRQRIYRVADVTAAVRGTGLRLLAAHDFRHIALSPGGAVDIRALGRGERMALYLGSEGEGLPAELLARLETVRIPIAQGFDSLNVAAASAIALHEIRNRIANSE